MPQTTKPQTTKPETTKPMSNEARIRELTAEWLRAVRAKDIGAVMRHYSTDLIAFDVMPPLSFKGADTYRRRWQAWFDSISGPVNFEMTDLNVVAGDDVACCHSVNRVHSKGVDGSEQDAWVRATVCFRKIGGKWLVVHEHASVPISMETAKS